VQSADSYLAHTDATGHYEVRSVPVGNYEVEVTKQGFRGEKRTGIHLLVGQDAVLGFQLQLGAVNGASNSLLAPTHPARVERSRSTPSRA